LKDYNDDFFKELRQL